MTASLPAFTDYEAFSPFRADPAQWLPIARDIARSHGLACTAPHVFATGTNLVLGLDEKLILKIFPPFLRGQFASERSTLLVEAPAPSRPNAQKKSLIAAEQDRADVAKRVWNGAPVRRS